MVSEQYSKDLDKAGFIRLSNAELIALRERAILGADQKAWHELWNHGLRLVLKIVSHMAERDVLRHIDPDEAISVGNAAIGEALLSWKPKLGPYATWIWIRIRGAILSFDKEEGVQGFLGTPVGGVEVVPNTQVAGSGEFFVSDLYEEGQTKNDPFDGVVSREQLIALRALPARERAYIYQVYVQGIPASDIARAEGVSRQRVDQVLSSALNRLRVALADREISTTIVVSKKDN